MPEMTEDMEVDIAQAAANPTASPIVVVARTCFIIERITAPGVAPRASRTPISCFRSPTATAIIPLMPEAVMHNATSGEDAQKNRGGSPWFEPVAAELRHRLHVRNDCIWIDVMRDPGKLSREFRRR